MIELCTSQVPLRTLEFRLYASVGTGADLTFFLEPLGGSRTSFALDIKVLPCLNRNRCKRLGHRIVEVYLRLL